MNQLGAGWDEGRAAGIEIGRSEGIAVGKAEGSKRYLSVHAHSLIEEAYEWILAQ
jgi:hypothetical protein